MVADWSSRIADIIVLLFAFFAVLSVHEAAHAGMAYLLGDDTAKRLGRLTLNPFSHIDPLGLLCLLVFRIGWAKPVIFDHRNFRRPKLYSVLTAYAGPTSNFLLTILVLVVLKFLPIGLLPVGVSATLVRILVTTAQVSVMLGVFNLLPIPPLDGSHLLMVLFLDRFPNALIWLYRYSLFILVAFFVVIPQTRQMLWYLINAVYTLLYRLVF